VTNRDLAAARQHLEAMQQRYAVALLAGRLVEAGGAAQPRSILTEATWPPISNADEVAEVCRYAEEFSALRKLGDSRRADEVERYLHDRVRRVLE
jgi:hypothetical protein